MTPIERLATTATYRVIYRDTDLAGHMYYGNYLALFEIGRTSLLRAMGGSYREWEERGYFLPVRRCEAEYHAPSFYDDELAITTRLHDLTPVRVEFRYRITRQDGPAGQAEAEAPAERAAAPTLICSGSSLHPLLRKDRRIARDLLRLMGELDITPELVRRGREAAADA